MEWIIPAFLIGSFLFTIWVSRTAVKIHDAINQLDDQDQRTDEIIEAVNSVVIILQQLPNLMPQYHLNQGNGIAEKIIEKLFGSDESIKPASTPRDDAGRYLGEK